MAVHVGDHARQVWSTLNDTDFAAIEALVVDLNEVDIHRRLDALPIAATGDGPYHHFIVVHYGHMTAVIAENTDLEIYALGRPTP